MDDTHPWRLENRGRRTKGIDHCGLSEDRGLAELASGKQMRGSDSRHAKLSSVLDKSAMIDALSPPPSIRPQLSMPLVLIPSCRIHVLLLANRDTHKAGQCGPLGCRAPSSKPSR